jgi:hypothetical protein
MSRFARSNRHELSSQIRCRTSLRTHRLSFALAAALASSALVAVTTKASAPAPHAQPIGSAAAASGLPRRPDVQTTWTVQNCDDSGANSLRDVIENPLNAKSGDIVDLSQLPLLCGMLDSMITLSNGEIAVQQNDLTLKGPSNGTVTISGAHMSRVFHHTGSGTFALIALTIEDGYYHAISNAYGGCIYSQGSAFLSDVVLTQCEIKSDAGWAKGGGIAALSATLVASKVSENQADGAGPNGYGGGVYSETSLVAKYSTINDNEAFNGTDYGRAGGMVARQGATLISSTIENNIAGLGGGIVVGGPTTILNSTISRNSAMDHGSGLIAFDTTLIANSTIAFNHQDSSDQPGGLYFHGTSASSTLTLQSSIIADNTDGAANTPADVYIFPGFGSLAGADNLVIASNVSDPAVITLTSDPKLGPLQFNGGRTRTHMLLPSSPALGKGNINGLPPSITKEERGPGYPRTTGPNSSVDLGAVQFDTIFTDSFDSFF